MTTPIPILFVLSAMLAVEPAVAAEAAPSAPAADVSGRDDASLFVHVPRYALSGGTVAVRLEVRGAPARSRYTVAVVTDTDRKRHVGSRGWLKDDGTATASITLPGGAGDHLLAVYVTVATAGSAPRTELLRVLVLDPNGDYDADRIPSAEEINLWWTDPTSPNLGCRPVDTPIDLSAPVPLS